MMVGMTARADCRGPEGVEWADSHYRKIERQMIGFRQLVGGNLRRGVGALTDQRVPFVDGGATGGAVGLRRGGVHQPPDAGRAAGFQDIQGAFDVGFHIGGRRPVGVGDGDQRR